MSQKTCKSCSKSFNTKGTSRSRCFECSPYKPNPLKSNRPIGELRICIVCLKELPKSNFSKTNKLGNLNSYCKDCSAKKKFRSTNRFKSECIYYKGGKCESCGYNKCFAAMEFHHMNPAEKSFAISRSKTTILTSNVKAELDKCTLLCSNCHREKEQEITLKKYNLTYEVFAPTCSISN